MADADAAELDELLARVPAGWSRHSVAGATWGVSRVERAGGRTTTLTAERFDSPGLISANIWHTSGGAVLRPCETSAETVLDFLERLPPAA